MKIEIIEHDDRMTISISKGTKDCELYNVPNKIGNAIIAIINVCENMIPDKYKVESEDKND